MRKPLYVMAALAVLAAASLPAVADDAPRTRTHAMLIPVVNTAPAGAAAPAAGAATLGAAGEGRRLYLKLNCYGCHGMGATGGMGPNIVHAEMGDVSEAVMQGEDSGMRSYSRYVSAVDVTNLAAYLASIGTASEPKFRDWWVPVPTK